MPRWPSASGIDVSADAPVRRISAEEVEEILAAHRRYLETGRKAGARASFRLVDLSGMDLSGRILRRARMDRARLADASLAGADLTKANLIGASAQRVDLSGAELTGARLGGINLAGAKLVGARLAGADLRGTQGLIQAQVDTARYDTETRLPNPEGQGTQRGE